MTGGLDIGSRNEAAVRAALAKARITVKAAQTGGNSGRTVKITVGESAGHRPLRPASRRRRLLEGRTPRTMAGAGAAR